ncbi:MAG: hypothetical protein HY928_10310 [Elusimicrobia bacterium]|nr:hypothetical protein [Elusimicrobiota bacterium]
MLGLGLSTCLAALMVPAVASAGNRCEKEAGKPAKGFSTKAFGEVPGEPCPLGPEDGDYRESASKGDAGEVPPAETSGPAPVDDGRDAPTAAPAIGAGQQLSVPARAHAEAETARARADAPAGVRWSWPGPQSPAARERRRAEHPDFKASDDEGLRDAPAAVAPERYSLWKGLSEPLLLPSGKVRGVSPAQAREMGERDYDSHILQSAAVQAPAAIGSDAPKTAAAAARQPVLVELDVSDRPGEWRHASAELAQQAGFEPVSGGEPRFIGEAKARVLIEGTVDAARTSDLLGVTRLKRLESGPIRAAASRPGETRLLVGLRIPQDASPSETLLAVSARLARSASFRLERPIAYQRVPGTSQMVVVAVGRLPVRSMGLLLSDPDVVKVAPSPSEEEPRAASAPAPAWKSFVRTAVREKPTMLLAAVLFCVALLGPFFRRSSRPKK